MAFLHCAVLGLEPHRDYLAGFGIIAKAGRVRHADEFVGDGIARHLQRFRDDLAQSVGVGAVGDDDELAVVEFIRPRRIGRIVQGHGERVAANLGKLHPSGLLEAMLCEISIRGRRARDRR
jgi:hypothetical protein